MSSAPPLRLRAYRMTARNDPLIAGENDRGKRLDRVLRQYCPGLALSAVYRLIRRKRVKVNGKPAGIAYRLVPGDCIDIPLNLRALTRAPAAPSVHSALRATAGPSLPSLILFQSDDVLALNKPYGLLVHGPDSLAGLVEAEFAADETSLSFRPGPAHRLDRNTTGLQLWSLSIAGARDLTKLFHDRQMIKIYCALVAGNLEKHQTWEDRLERDPVGRKTIAARQESGDTRPPAFTAVVPVFPGRDRSLVFFLPKTGLTHQLRVQAALHGHPLPGDRKYGGSADQPRYLLHCLGLVPAKPTLNLPPLVAPFDRFELATINTTFGPGAVEHVYRRCREMLANTVNES
jgi:23S rRNA pseudouridine955/2504/2580 synthase